MTDTNSSTMAELSAARRVLSRMSAEAFVAALSVEEQNALRKALDVYGPYVGTWVVDAHGLMSTGMGPPAPPIRVTVSSGHDKPLHVHVREFLAP